MTIIYRHDQAVWLNFSFPYNLAPFGVTSTLVPQWFSSPTTNPDVMFTLIRSNGDIAQGPDPLHPTIDAIPLQFLSAWTNNKIVPIERSSSYTLQIYIDPDMFIPNQSYGGAWTAIVHWDTNHFGLSAYPMPQYIHFDWGGTPEATYDLVQPCASLTPTYFNKVNDIHTETTTFGTPPNETVKGLATAAMSYSGAAVTNTQDFAAPSGTLRTAINNTLAATTTDVSSPKNLLHYIKTALDSHYPAPALTFGTPNMADQTALLYWMFAGLKRTFDPATGRINLDISTLPGPIPPSLQVYFECFKDDMGTPATSLAEVVVQGPIQIVV